MFVSHTKHPDMGQASSHVVAISTSYQFVTVNMVIEEPYKQEND